MGRDGAGIACELEHEIPVDGDKDLQAKLRHGNAVGGRESAV